MTQQVISLTQEQRGLLAGWLEQEARTNEELADQMDKIPHNLPVAKHLRTEAKIFGVVASKLRSIEDMSIGG